MTKTDSLEAPLFPLPVRCEEDKNGLWITNRELSLCFATTAVHQWRRQTEQVEEGMQSISDGLYVTYAGPVVSTVLLDSGS